MTVQDLIERLSWYNSSLEVEVLCDEDSRFELLTINGVEKKTDDDGRKLVTIS